MDELRKLLIRHEGIRLKPYRDTTGHLTIGVGRNLDDEGITHREAMVLLNNDIDHFHGQLAHLYDWYGFLNRARQDAMISMAFNLGLRGFASFKRMISALKMRDYELAAAEMLNSKWAGQVGDRAEELADMMRRGFYSDHH